MNHWHLCAASRKAGQFRADYPGDGTELANEYKVDPTKNSAQIPRDVDFSWLGEVSDDGTSILCLDVDLKDNDLYIDGVRTDHWVVGFGYGSSYRCLGVSGTFSDALETARDALMRFKAQTIWYSNR